MSRFANLADKPVVRAGKQIRWNRRAPLPNFRPGRAQGHLRLLQPEMSLALHLCAACGRQPAGAHGRGVQ
jgi:hypothetical protein